MDTANKTAYKCARVEAVEWSLGRNASRRRIVVSNSYQSVKREKKRSFINVPREGYLHVTFPLSVAILSTTILSTALFRISRNMKTIRKSVNISKAADRNHNASL
jgi:hypothetical protein